MNLFKFFTQHSPLNICGVFFDIGIKLRVYTPRVVNENTEVTRPGQGNWFKFQIMHWSIGNFSPNLSLQSVLTIVLLTEMVCLYRIKDLFAFFLEDMIRYKNDFHLGIYIYYIPYLN